MELSEIRTRIDSVDDQILNLFLELLHVLVVLFDLEGGLFFSGDVFDRGDDALDIDFDRELGEIAHDVHTKGVTDFLLFCHFFNNII